MIDQTRPSAHVNIHRCLLIILSFRNLNVYVSKYILIYNRSAPASSAAHSHVIFTSILYIVVAVTLSLLVRGACIRPSTALLRPPSPTFISLFTLLVCWFVIAAPTFGRSSSYLVVVSRCVLSISSSTWIIACDAMYMSMTVLCHIYAIML
jgi:hypothetical protein